ncbi:hypothetical protein GGI12_003733 [Dipsacomyces acuminosporus]|nr:hypothetical protein GGI12_003733 [Dipsacomyces acuminosporus]
MLLDKGLPGLLKLDNELVTEIRQIDGDMKTMVYENYSKFISATETIKKMKEEADFMDSEMSKLTKRINEISTKTTSINSKVLSKRENIQRLTKEYKLMKNLQFLFDLPDQLNKYIGIGKFVEAARLWSKTQPLLEHYRQLGVFDAVEKDGKEIMASVELNIWDRWQNFSTGIAEGAECASLLVLLHPEKTNQLWKEYLDLQGMKIRNKRQEVLDASYQYPILCGLPVSVQTPVDATNIDPDPSGTSLPAIAASLMSPVSDNVSRVSYFNKQYLPLWNSLVIGFASQFISPMGSGLLEQVPDSAAKSSMNSNDGRTMSLLEANTEGTVVGLLSPLAEDGRVATKLSNQPIRHNGDQQLVVGWQAMSTKELTEAQTKFSEQLKEWCSDYELVVDSLIQYPDDGTKTNIKTYLGQLDELVSSISQYPILSRIGGLHDVVYRLVKRWQEHLIKGLLHSVVKDMLERVEYYFDPMVDNIDVVVSTPVVPMTATTNSMHRNSSVSRHQRNSSIKSAHSLNDFTTGHHHQRASSAVSAGIPIDKVNHHQQQRVIEVSSPISGTASTAPNSPLQAHTQQLNLRGIINQNRGTPPFDAHNISTPLTSVPTTGPMSPSINSFALSSTGQRVSRSSTFHLVGSSRAGITSNLTTNRPSSLRKTQHQRTSSNALTDNMEPVEDGNSKGDTIKRLKRSLSLHRTNVRGYKPWVISTVNRNAPLHVFLADIESWLIQQILERVNPVLEAVVQHYLDIEASQMLDEDDDDDEDDGDSSVGGNGGNHELKLQLPVATKLRQSFIKTLDDCLDTWMSNWMPDAFIYSSLANPIYGTKDHVEKAILESPMAQFGISIVSDPVASLLLARFAVDFELTLTQSIYQLCEQGISILPDDANNNNNNGNNNQKRAGDTSGIDINNLVGSAANILECDNGGRVYSITSNVRADSMASANSRRGTFIGKRDGSSLLKFNQSKYSSKWHSIAEQLVKHFIMTVGQYISSDYLKLNPYNSTEGGEVAGVSGIWINICRWLKQVEDDTNALFYDPLFSATLKYVDSMTNNKNSDSDKPSLMGQTSAGFNGLRLSINGSNTGGGSKLHADILSNIDRLFAERVDIFPLKGISPLGSGKIMTLLSLNIIKTALEDIRLRANVIEDAQVLYQIVVDASFIKSWCLRYTGKQPSDKSEVGRRGGPQQPQQPQQQQQDSSTPVANERDAQAIQNLVDDWISSALALSLCDHRLPESKFVDKVVASAWMVAYFGQNAEQPTASNEED